MMTSTIEDLSTEILVEIFSHYIKSEGHVAFSLLVAPVCKTWWEASSTASLWKSFRVQNWNFARFVCNKGLLNYTESLEIPAVYMRRRPGLLDCSHLSAVLSNINDLKSLEISNYDIDLNTMTIVAEHCPNLEHFSMTGVESGECEQITLGELSPILNICGPQLKHISFTDCRLEDIKQLFTEIAAKCESLETLELINLPSYLQRHDKNMFPIHKFASGCPQLRKLKLSNCRFAATGENDCSGFKDLIVFKAERCYYRGVDVCDLLKNSVNLKYLELSFLNKLVRSDVSKIPSNNLKFLGIWLSEIDTNLKAVEEVVDKWKHTLLNLHIYSMSGNLTSILRTYLDNNPQPKLEELWINKGCVDPSFLKVFIQKCHNLNELWNLKEHGLRLVLCREKVA